MWKFYKYDTQYSNAFDTQIMKEKLVWNQLFLECTKLSWLQHLSVTELK